MTVATATLSTSSLLPPMSRPLRSPRSRVALAHRVVAVLVAQLLVQGFAAGSLRADTSLLVGAAFQINALTGDPQTQPDVVVRGDGSFVVTWQSVGSAGTDSDGTSIQARLYDTNGSPLGAPFQVNELTAGEQTSPSIAAASNGSFVVVWTSETSPGDTSGTSVKLRRFDSAGAALAGEAQVNSITSGDQTTGYSFDSRFQAIAMAPSGDFVVVWLGAGVRAQLYNAAGVTVGSEFQVDSSGSSEVEPSVAMGSDGSFVVVWSATGGPGSDIFQHSIQAQRHDASGSPQGSQFQVNVLTPGDQRKPRVDFFSNGGFVVVWENFFTLVTIPFSESNVRGLCFDPNGSPLLGEFEIDQTQWELEPAVATEPGGEFVLTWSRGLFPWVQPEVWALRFSGAGFQIGHPIQIDDGSAFHHLPAIDATQDDAFVIAWSNPGFDLGGPYHILGSQTLLGPQELPSLSPSRLALLACLTAAAGAVAAKRRTRRT